MKHYHNGNISLQIHADDKVKYFPYRTAQIGIILAETKIDQKAEAFMNTLFEIVGEERPDNHVCFTVTNKEGYSYSLAFSDGEMYIGTGIIEENW